MRQLLFVQGAGGGTHASWDNKLVASLEQALGADYAIRYPRMPDEDNPDPTAWKKTIARETKKLSDGMFLVGHSIGAAILLEYLAGAAIARRVAGVFLIATPFIGDGGWPSDDLRPTTQLAVDLRDGAPLYFYQGRDDDTVPFAHLDMLATAFPGATIRGLDGRDHQLNDDLSEVARDIAHLALHKRVR
jgi:predicted alpha/beta hydrolase family esterase